MDPFHLVIGVVSISILIGFMLGILMMDPCQSTLYEANLSSTNFIYDIDWNHRLIIIVVPHQFRHNVLSEGAACHTTLSLEMWENWCDGKINLIATSIVPKSIR